MRHIPILFSTPMVQAIIQGNKTQTRRVCKHQFWSHSELVDINSNGITQKVNRSVSCPYGQVGDVLWVREKFVESYLFDEDGNIQRDEFGEPFKTFFYYATEGQTEIDWIDEDGNNGAPIPWKPSIHMPREACRLFLEITDIRVERLQDITEEDAIAEGILVEEDGFMCWDYLKNDWGQVGFDPVSSFESLWEAINGEDSWNENPWVWVVEFKKIDKPANF